jgi:hypothetical protein
LVRAASATSIALISTANLAGCSLAWARIFFRWTIVIELEGQEKRGSRVFEIACERFGVNLQTRAVSPMIDLGARGLLFATVVPPQRYFGVPPSFNDLEARYIGAAIENGIEHGKIAFPTSIVLNRLLLGYRACGARDGACPGEPDYIQGVSWPSKMDVLKQAKAMEIGPDEMIPVFALAAPGITHASQLAFAPATELASLLGVECRYRTMHVEPTSAYPDLALDIDSEWYREVQKRQDGPQFIFSA